MLSPAEKADLEEFVAALRKDYGKLSARIRTLTHSVACQINGVTIRLHFPVVSQGHAKTTELVNCLANYITPFALPRSQLMPIAAEYGKISEEEYRIKREQLKQEAIELFIKANKATNRNGEAGELLLYLLTEWVLKAPQLIAKLCLKTDRNAPVLGPDGIHINYSPERKALIFYCGESKLIGDVGRAMADTAESIKAALADAEHEIRLVSRHIHLSGADEAEKLSLLQYLDPNDENYNKRVDITTCLIGFNFEGFNELTADSDDKAFAKLAEEKLKNLAPRLEKILQAAGIKNRLIEVFFFPLPSVQDFRDAFQEKIGWK